MEEKYESKEMVSKSTQKREIAIDIVPRCLKILLPVV